jgi:hypothetical protein
MVEVFELVTVEVAGISSGKRPGQLKGGEAPHKWDIEIFSGAFLEGIAESVAVL